jgi:hypothetical protein
VDPVRAPDPPTRTRWWAVVLALILGLVIGGFSVSQRQSNDVTIFTRSATVQGMTSSHDGVGLTWDDGTTGGLAIAPDISQGTELLVPSARVQLTYVSIPDHGELLLQASPEA